MKVTKTLPQHLMQALLLQILDIHVLPIIQQGEKGGGGTERGIKGLRKSCWWWIELLLRLNKMFIFP